MTRMTAAAILAMGFFGFASVAAAQTTMEKEEMRERGELPEEEEESSSKQSTQRESSQRESTQQEEEEERRGDEYIQNETSWVHLPGLRFDWGGTAVENGDNHQSFAIGVGYMYAWEWDLKIFRSGSMLRIGAGPEVNFVTDDWSGLRGISTYATGRVTGVGGRGGIGIEAGAGLGIGGGGLRPLLKGGVFLASRTFEVGYYYQRPIGPRTDWLTAHHLGFRLHIPLFRSGAGEQ